MKWSRDSTKFQVVSHTVTFVFGIIWGVSLLVFAEVVPALNAQKEKDRQDVAKGGQPGSIKKGTRRSANIVKNRNRGRNARGHTIREVTPLVKIADVVRDFSTSLNPNGVWSYGWASAQIPDSKFIPYHNFYVLQAGIHKWYVSRSNSEEPSISYNTIGGIAHYGSVVHPPDLLNLHPGPNGERSVLRWTAPETGYYLIEGRFEGIQKGDLYTVPATRGTTTNVTIVYKNSIVLFNQNVDDYGKVAQISNLTRMISKGETVDFSVGLGNDGAFRMSSTGIMVRITPIQVPR